MIHPDQFLEPKKKKKPTGGAQLDDLAWEKIGDLFELQDFEEAKAIFMTRCAESAQEAITQDAPRRAALEKVDLKSRNIIVPHIIPKDGPCMHCDLVRAHQELDALTPAKEKS